MNYMSQKEEKQIARLRNPERSRGVILKSTAATENGFKMTDLGPLPEEWGVVRLSDVAEFSKKPRALSLADSEMIPFVPMEHIPNDSTFSAKYDFRKPQEIRSGTFFHKGDLLVAKITPCFENGKQGIVNELPTDFGYATTEVWPLHATDSASILFLSYYLKMRSVRAEIAGKMEGTTGRQRVPKHVLEVLEIPLPPLSEQKKIAGVLSGVQEAKEKTEAVIQAAKELKKSLMKHLFTYGPVSIKEAENVSLKETEIGSMSKTWNVVEFRALLRQGTQNGVYKPRKHYGKGVPIVDMRDIFASSILAPERLERLELGTSDMCKYSLCDGDLLFARRSFKAAGSGKCQLVETTSEPTVFSSSIIRVSPEKDQVISKCYLYFFLSPSGRRTMGRIIRHLAVSGISGGDLRTLPVPQIPLAEQRMISEALSAIDQKIEAEENKKKALEELFKTLLENLMTAKIRVKDLEATA